MLSLRQCTAYAMLGFLWLFATALLFSYAPTIQWQGQPVLFPNSYVELSMVERCLELFYKWDSRIYIALAQQGYPPIPSWEHAFFPGWPYLLKLLSFVTSTTDEPRALGIAVLPINLLLSAIALYTWSRVFNKVVVHFNPHRFVWMFLMYPTSIFLLTPYPEIAFVALLGCCTLCMLDSSIYRWLWIAIPALISIKHAGIAMAFAFPIWSLLQTKRIDFTVWASYLAGIFGILVFFLLIAGDPFAWLKAQALWGRTWSWPWRIWQDLHGKGVELALYVAWIFIAPVWLAQKSGGAIGILSGKNAYALLFLITSAVFVPMWFGSSTASVYRVVFLATPALLLPLALTTNLSPRRSKAAIAFLLILNLHATYRFVAGLHLA